MLALADDAALARLVIAATSIPRRARRARVQEGRREPPTRSRNARCEGDAAALEIGRSLARLCVRETP